MKIDTSGKLMTQEELLREIASLPIEGQRQVIDFIAFLRQRYSQSQLSEHHASNLFTENFIGIWKDHDDLKDSSVWVRRTREGEWAK